MKIGIIWPTLCDKITFLLDKQHTDPKVGPTLPGRMNKCLNKSVTKYLFVENC